MMVLLMPLMVMVQSDATEVERLLAAARAARNQSRWVESIAVYDQLLRLDKGHEAALFERAQTLGWSKRYEASIEAWRDFGERFPARKEEADENLAKVASWGRHFEIALKTMAPYVEQGKRWAVLDSAKYMSWDGRYREALARCDAWLENQPKDAEALLLKARVLSWDGRLGRAEESYSELLDYRPDLHDARMGLAQISVWSGRPERAREIYEKLPTDVSQTPEAKLLDGQIALAEGRRMAGRKILKPLAAAGSAVEHDASDLLRGLAEQKGFSLEVGQIKTDTSEDLIMREDYARLKVPMGNGNLGFNYVKSYSEFMEREAEPYALSLSAAYPLGPLSLYAEGGRIEKLPALVDGKSDEKPAGFHRVGLDWRALSWLRLSVEQGRTLVLLTPQAVDKRVGLASVDATLLISGLTDTLRLQAGQASLSAGNKRQTWSASYEHRWRISPFYLTTGITGRSLSFDKTLPLGFWNPEQYRFYGLTGGLSYEKGRFFAAAEGRWGRQWVEQEDPTNAWGYGVNVSWGIGRTPFTLMAGWSESTSMLNAYSVIAPDKYKEQTLRWGLRIAGPSGWK